MALSMITIAKVALASAAGYAAARWLARSRNRLHAAGRPAFPTALTHDAGNQPATPDESWQPREGGHPGREPVEFGASDRPGG